MSIKIELLEFDKYEQGCVFRAQTSGNLGESLIQELLPDDFTE